MLFCLATFGNLKFIKVDRYIGSRINFWYLPRLSILTKIGIPNYQYQEAEEVSSAQGNNELFTTKFQSGFGEPPRGLQHSLRIPTTPTRDVVPQWRTTQTPNWPCVNKIPLASSVIDCRAYNWAQIGSKHRSQSFVLAKAYVWIQLDTVKLKTGALANLQCWLGGLEHDKGAALEIKWRELKTAVTEADQAHLGRMHRLGWVKSNHIY